MTEAAQKRCFRPGECWVIVPAKEEADRIGAVVTALRATGAAVLVVDDASRDKTAEIAEGAGATVLRHPVNRGQGAALETGFAYLRPRSPRCTVTFDGDGQHDAADLSALAEPILRGEMDVVLGSRFRGTAEGIPRSRLLVLKAAILWTRWMTGMAVTDTHNGVRALSRTALETIRIQQDRMAHASEILDRIAASQLKWMEMPVRVRYDPASRRKGQSSFGAIRIVVDYLIERWVR